MRPEATRRPPTSYRVVLPPGQGSPFWLTARERGGAAAPAEAPAECVLTREYCGKRVLLAEDEPTNQTVAMAPLCLVGLEPPLARDGAEAVRLASEGEYDVILMDMQMPEMSGVEATRAIRRLPGREAVPIVAMTANAFDDNHEACLAAGMNDVLAEPIDWDTLCEILLKCFGRAKSGVARGARSEFASPPAVTLLAALDLAPDLGERATAVRVLAEGRGFVVGLVGASVMARRLARRPSLVTPGQAAPSRGVE